MIAAGREKVNLLKNDVTLVASPNTGADLNPKNIKATQTAFNRERKN